MGTEATDSGPRSGGVEPDLDQRQRRSALECAHLVAIDRPAEATLGQDPAVDGGQRRRRAE